jgi:hypothetical protein
MAAAAAQSTPVQKALEAYCTKLLKTQNRTFALRGYFEDNNTMTRLVFIDAIGKKRTRCQSSTLDALFLLLAKAFPLPIRGGWKLLFLCF